MNLNVICQIKQNKTFILRKKEKQTVEHKLKMWKWSFIEMAFFYISQKFQLEFQAYNIKYNGFNRYGQKIFLSKWMKNWLFFSRLPNDESRPKTLWKNKIIINLFLLLWKYKKKIIREKNNNKHLLDRKKYVVFI